MAAKFTNLRPAEAKPIEQLRELHTPLYAKGETSLFLDQIVNAGLPAGIGVAAVRLAGVDFLARAESAQAGGPAPAGSPLTPLGGVQLIEVARYLARADPEALLVEVQRGELMPAFAERIAAAAKEPTTQAGTIVQDDLLALILIPGAFATYRRLLGKLLMLKRLVKDSGRNLAELLLPASPGMIDDLHGPWPGDKVPLAWLKLLRGKNLLHPLIAVRPVPVSGGPSGGVGSGGRFDSAFATSGLSLSDRRQIEMIATTAFTDGTAASSAPATKAAKKSAAAAVRSKD